MEYVEREIEAIGPSEKFGISTSFFIALRGVRSHACRISVAKLKKLSGELPNAKSYGAYLNQYAFALRKPPKTTDVWRFETSLETDCVNN